MPIIGNPGKNDWYLSPGGNIWEATGAEAFALRVAGWKGPMSHAEAEALLATVPAPLRAVNKATTHALKGFTSPLEAITHIWDTLSSRNTLLRIAEGAIGILLILVGVAKLATDSPIARTVAKAGLI